MYLRLDERELGKENFCAAIASKPVRREFLKKIVRQDLTVRNGLGAYYFNYGKPSEPLRVGVIGCGEQGRRLIAAINPAYILVKSIADLRPSNRRQAIAGDDVPPTPEEKKKDPKAGPKPKPGTGLMGVYKEKKADDFKAYSTYQELLEKAKADGLEAVIIALPSHLHATVALAAIDAGLHVMIEPPMALTVADAKKVARKAKEKKLCLAIGSQRRYSAIYDNALELVRKGITDDVHFIRGQWHLKKEDKGEDKDASKAAKKDERKLDWWREVPAEDAGVKAKDHGYASVEELVRWQLWEKLSGGLLMELGTQLFDAASLFMAATPNRSPDRDFPLSVTASASQLMPAIGGDVDDHVYCVFEYQAKDYTDKGYECELPQKARKKIGLQYDLIIGNDFDGYGETVLGKTGSLVLEHEQDGLLYKMSDTDKKTRVIPKKDEDGKPLPDQGVLDIPKDAARAGDEESEAIGQAALFGADPGFAAELEHWAACVRNPSEQNKPRCDALAGLAATVLAAAAAQAIKSGTRVDFVKEWFDPESDKTPGA